jgi:hypothetical protein
MPGPVDAETQREIDEILVGLGKESPVETKLAWTRRHLGKGPDTLVFLAYGRRQDDDSPVICLWHHPAFSLGRACYLALIAISSDETHRVKRG